MKFCTPNTFFEDSLAEIQAFALWGKTTQTVFSIKAKGVLYLLHLQFIYLQLFYYVSPTSFLCLPGKASLLEMHPTLSAPH